MFAGHFWFISRQLRYAGNAACEEKVIVGVADIADNQNLLRPNIIEKISQEIFAGLSLT